MPFFKSTSRKSKGTPPGGDDGDGKGKSAVPAIDMEAAAAKIEARQRGKMARKKTESMKADRSHYNADPFAALLKKCLPCL